MLRIKVKIGTCNLLTSALHYSPPNGALNHLQYTQVQVHMHMHISQLTTAQVQPHNICIVTASQTGTKQASTLSPEPA